MSTRQPPALEIGVTPPVAEYLRRFWARRDFILAVPIGQLRAQTQNTVLGAAWHLLNPLFTAALYYFVFGVLFGGSGRVEDYPAFLVVGLFAFLYTNRTVTAGAKSVTGNLGLVSQINFPRIALPTAAAIAETISHGMAIVALFVMVPILGAAPAWTWLLVLPAVALQAVFNLGLAMVVARLAFQYRDIENLLPHLLHFWMYVSGLFFTVDFVINVTGANSPAVSVFRLNPAYIYMSLMRDAFLGRSDASAEIWLGAVLWSVLAVVVGFCFFRAREVEYGRG